jgi:DNA mismatch repair protein MutS2
MNGHALGVLEYDKVVEMLVERTSFPLGAERAERLRPVSDAEWIREELERVTELRTLMDGGASLPLEGARDVREALARSLAVGVSLTCGELVAVAETLSAIQRVSSFLSARREACPRIGGVASDLAPRPELARAITSAIDAESLEVRDGASRELSKIRRSIGRTRGRLDEKLQTILQQEASAGTIQEPAIHIRNGRHVLPVRKDARGRLEGIVHDQSGSGATLFVEPLSTVGLNNELSALAAAERQEIERILRELSREVGASAADMERSVEVLGVLDFERAKAALSRDLACEPPRMTEGNGRLSILNGRHPILVAGRPGVTVIPLSVELGEGATTLVVSGPNAGGKTVALKTIGLLAAMAQSGLHVPADPDTEIPVFRDLFADIGDEQSIEQNLSTFSSHLSVIGEILREADEETLVLIDEMGAGTDPDEGASLAIAILERLCDRQARTVATTHLGAVKGHVHNRRGMVNGSMAFDPDTLEPTFRFVPGVPGASHALSIAESLGLPTEVLERARELRDTDAAEIDELLADLSERQSRLAAAVTDAEAQSERAKILVRDYEGRLTDVREERRQIRARALAEAREIVERGQSLVEDTVRELRARDAAKKAIKDARAALRRRRAEAERELEAELGTRSDDGEPPSELAVGMRVRVAGLEREGELVSTADAHGRVRVRIRNATVEVDAAELRSVDTPDDAGAPAASRVVVNVTPGNAFSSEFHLRGMTADEASDAIERFISAALVHGFSTVRIVHGKGTGALRRRTHEVLRGLPAVKSFRLGGWGEGDTGVTVVELG